MTMFRFSAWRPYGHDWAGWMAWFRKAGIYAEVRRCTSLMLPAAERHRHHPREKEHSAIFRLGADAFGDNAPEIVDEEGEGYESGQVSASGSAR